MKRAEIEVNNKAKKGRMRYAATLLGQKSLFYGEKTIFCGTSTGNVEWARWAYLKLGTGLGLSFCCFTPLPIKRLSFFIPHCGVWSQANLVGLGTQFEHRQHMQDSLDQLARPWFSHWIINNYWTRLRKISWFVSGEQINHLPQPSASANNWSTRHW